MPLQILPDRFGEAKHKELDKAVNAATQHFNAFSAQQMLPFQQYLLTHIVAASNGELDLKIAISGQTLIDTYGSELRDMLSSAWERKSYRDRKSVV